MTTVNILQADSSTLTTDQWNLLSNLSNCYDENSGLSVCENFMHDQNNLPLKLRFKSSALIEFFASTLQISPLLYLKNRDFLSLCSDDRSLLLQGTCRTTLSFTTNFVYRQTRVCDYPTFYPTLALITNQNVSTAIERLQPLLDFDVIIMKLFVAILSFSTVQYENITHSNLSGFVNLKEVLRIQDSYIELAWKYFVYQYDYKRAVGYFTHLIRCFFIAHDGVVKANGISWCKREVGSLITKTEQTLLLNN